MAYEHPTDGMRDVYTMYTALAGALAVVPEPTPITKAAAGILAAAQALGFGVVIIWEATATAGEKEGGPGGPGGCIPFPEGLPTVAAQSAPSTGALLTVKAPRPAPLPGTGSLITALNNTLIAGTRTLDSSHQLSCTLDRLHAALGQSDHADLQRASARNYLARLEGDVELFSVTLEHLGREVQGTEIDKVRTTRQQVLDLRDQIVRTGDFPDFEKAIVEEILSTENERALIIKSLEGLTGAQLPETANASELCFLGAAEQRRVSIRNLMPDYF